MKTILTLTALMTAWTAQADEPFRLPRIQPTSYQGFMPQPCLQWWTNGSCARYATGFDAADREKTNEVVGKLEKKIRELDERLRRLEKEKNP